MTWKMLSQPKARVAAKVVKKKKPTLKEVMKNIDASKFHPFIDFGPDVGKEIIE